jgi:hypothetical protein
MKIYPIFCRNGVWLWQNGHLAEELSRVLHLEHVRLLRLLVDGDLRVTLAALQGKKFSM